MARNVGTQLEKRFAVLERVAKDKEFARLVRDLTDDETAGKYLKVLGEPEADASARSMAKSEFQIMELRRNGKKSADGTPSMGMQSQMENYLSDRRLPGVASWFVTDANGTMLAAAFPRSGGISPVGDNFRYRTYFHGGLADDYSEGHVVSRDFLPLDKIQLSTPFQSTATNTYKVAISAPVKFNNETIGVVAITLELGDFVQFPENTPDFCAVLVDGRPNKYAGIILQHPLLGQLKGSKGELPEEINIGEEKLRANLELLKDEKLVDYDDPLGALDEQYAGKWIAAAAPVTYPRSNDSVEEFDTGLRLVVERRVQAVIEPVSRLAVTLFREAIAALVAITLVSVLLWYFVLRMMQDSLAALRSGPTTEPASQSVHSRDTVAMPGDKQ